ncbi:MAG: 2-dehydro-3-deoxygalactonokinase [Pirellulales bacterium]
MARIFISCDWGTTHFRLRLVAADQGRPEAEFSSAQGAAAVAASAPSAQRAEAFRRVLADGLQQLVAGGQRESAIAQLPVIISGMASSSIGWQQLDYARVPWRLDGNDAAWRELEPLAAPTGPHRVLLLSGVRTDADILRGEETQSLGVYQLHSADLLAGEALVVLPGTHSKHLHIAGHCLTGFQTFMTGELFEVLGSHSILRHSVADAPSASSPAETDARAQRTAFLAGVEHAAGLPLSAALFRVRTRQVLDDADPAGNRAFLSGLVIGAELAHLAQASNQAPRTPIVLCATPTLAEPYVLAGESLGLAGRLHVLPADEVERLTALGQARLAQCRSLL